MQNPHTLSMVDSVERTNRRIGLPLGLDNSGGLEGFSTKGFDEVAEETMVSILGGFDFDFDFDSGDDEEELKEAMVGLIKNRRSKWHRIGKETGTGVVEMEVKRAIGE